MATVALAMIGSAIGAAAMPAGLTLLGTTISGAAIGQAIGGALGGMIDQAIFAPKAPDTEGPRLESVTFSNVAEGAPLARLYGVTRPTCPLIWATRFREEATEEEVGGKGMGGGATHTTYAYFCSFAVALGERADEIRRIFFDGQALGDLVLAPHPHGFTIAAMDETFQATFYDGTQEAPDALIASVEGAAPAYRGVAYLVVEELALANHGNRLPMVSAEAERRLSAPNLTGLLARIAEDYGASVDLEAVPEREVWGLKVERAMSGRAALEAVMGPFQLTGAFGDDGSFRVSPLQGAPLLTIGEEELVEAEGGGAPLTISRARGDDAPGEVRLSYPDVDRDHQPAEVVARRRLQRPEGATTIQTAMPLSRAAAMSLAHEALETGAMGRETARGILAPSVARLLRPGQILGVRMRTGREHHLRLTNLAWEGRGPFEGVITAMTPPRARIAGGSQEIVDAVQGYGPVELVFLDLPLLRGDENAFAPHVAAWADPWNGALLFRSVAGGPQALAAIVPSRATMGELEASLAPPAAPWVWDPGAELLVRLRPGGLLSSATEAAAEAGANAGAIEWPEGWEVLQWRAAELVSSGLWRLSHLRRGMRGTEHLISGAAAVGARFARLNGALIQPDLPPTLRGQPQSWLWGPANRPRDHGSYQSETRSFAGVGLRPYAPVALAGALDGTDLVLTWARRSRGEPDTAFGPDLPLNEEREAYRVEIRSGAALLRTATVSTPAYAYPAADRMADGAPAPATLTVIVRQISAVFGPGAPCSATFTF
ncbi:phage tail protein [Neomegalonema sp.]|uniref:phage tail protein n=1 Tax=Neomegalonema sp. TaxID=2039713 RepID=UPI00262794A6|nr:phage tail protein [Neomegalonema sp.]MDD2870297.1 phage tail protein [Neomegalonema sp.]